MSKIIENYILQEVIGAGQYGKVFRSQNMKNDEVFAIKVVKLGKFKEVPKLHEFTMNEIKTLSKIENPNVIRFVEMLQTCNNVYLVYEFCNGGTLENLIQKTKFLCEAEALHVFQQIMNAFKSLIKENILHRDLKPSNILLNDGVIKVADFGFCKALLGPQDLTKTMVGSPIYMAPEILKGCNYSIKADIWSMGVVLFEMLFGYCPYEDRTIARLINQIDHKVLSIPKHVNKISKKTEDLLRKLLVVDPKYRIEWSQLLKINLFEDEQKVNLPSNPMEKRMLQKKTSSTSQMMPCQNILPTPQVYNQIPQPQIHYNNNENLLTNPNANVSVNIRTTTNNGVLASINNAEERHMPVILQQPNLTQTQINQNLRVLLKERNKIIFMMNVLTNMLENPLNEKGPIVGFCLFKNVMQLGEILKAALKEENIEKTNFAKKIEKIELFKETNEFKSFVNVFSKELLQISGCLACFKDDLKVEGNHSYDSFDQRKVLLENLNKYLEDIKEKVNVLAIEGKNEEMRQLLVIGNELMDCVNIDEFFEKFISENMKFGEQKYFEDLKRYSLSELNQIFLGKIEHMHEMVRM